MTKAEKLVNYLTLANLNLNSEKSDDWKGHRWRVKSTELDAQPFALDPVKETKPRWLPNANNVVRPAAYRQSLASFLTRQLAMPRRVRPDVAGSGRRRS